MKNYYNSEAMNMQNEKMEEMKELKMKNGLVRLVKSLSQGCIKSAIGRSQVRTKSVPGPYQRPTKALSTPYQGRIKAVSTPYQHSGYLYYYKRVTHRLAAVFALLVMMFASLTVGAQTVLFSQDFEGGSMPSGWTTDGPGTWQIGTGDYSTNTGAGHGTYNALIKHGTTGNVTKLITPPIDLSSATSAELSFMHVQRSWAGDIDQLRVYYRTSTSGTWTLITGCTWTGAVASWTTHEHITLPNINSTYQLAFEATDKYGYGVGIDYINIIGVSCAGPTGLAVTNSGQSATVTWTAGSGSQWDVAHSTNASADPSSNIVATGVTSPTYTMNNLALDNDHYFWVRTRCSGSEQSSWAGPVSVHIGYCYPAPSSVDGSGITSVTFTGNNSVTNTNRPTTTPYYGNYTAQVFQVQAGMEATLAITYETGYTYSTYVWVDLDNSMSFETGEIVCSGESSSSNPTTLTLTFTIPANQPAGNYRLRIGGADSGMDNGNSDPCYSGYYGMFEDFTLRVLPPPSCLQPSAITFTSITSSSAIVNWTENGTATNWTLQYSTSSDFTSGVTGVNITSKPYTITGLSPVNTYYVRVRANCGGGNGNSEWSTANNFSTTAVATVVGNEWCDNFEGASCGWERFNGNITNAWAWGTATNNGGTHSIYISNDGGTSNAYSSGSSSMVYATKLLTFSDGTYQFAYDWKAYGESDYYDYLRVALVPAPATFTAGTGWPDGFNNTSLPSGWTALDGGSRLNQVSTWQTKSVAIDVVAGNYYMVLAWWNDGGGGYNPPAAVDNVCINRICGPMPTDLAVTNSGQSATVTWTAGGGTQWDVAHSTNASADPSSNIVATGVTSPTYTMNDLALDNDHYFWVRTRCSGSDQSAWAGPVSVHIGYCNPAPSSVDGSGITSVTFTGGNTVTNTTHPTSSPYYGDYHLSVTAFEVQAGNTATLAITYQTSSYDYNTYVWVDLDNSLTFESSEIVCSGTSSSSSPNTLTLTFTIPANQATGTYRLRIGGADSGMPNEASANPCYNGTYGIFEDYTLQVLPSCQSPTGVTVTNITTETATVNWSGSASGYNIRWTEVVESDHATITLTAGDVWGDGSGYQMLLDADANTYGTIIPTTGGLTTSGDADAATYAEFEYKIPTNADGSLTTSNIVFNNSITITVPRGTYDWCITNPTPGDRMWIASNNGNIGGRADDYVFGGWNYEFVVSYNDPAGEDQTNVTITPNIPATFDYSAEGVTGNTYNITELRPGVTYIVQVQSDCGGGETSAWSSPEIFTTSCPIYSENFENGATGWVFANGDITNKWVRGRATSNGGSYSVYISNDGGTSNAYTNNSSAMVYAYKSFNLAGGRYQISYDWENNGESSYDFLRVALVPATVVLNAATDMLTDFSYETLPTGWIALDGGNQLYQSSTWQKVANTIDVPAGNYNLVFAWRNDGSLGSDPPAAFDNVEVRKINPIPTPTISGTTPVCYGNQTILSTGDFASYNWSTGATTQSITPTPTSNTDYTVTVTDADGCEVTSPAFTVAVDRLDATIQISNP